MFGYIIGSVKYLTSNYIVLDNHGIGYIIFVPNPYAYEEGKEYTVYTHQYINETENALYGFKTLEEKDLFLKLINVKGLGPKTAIPMLATGSVNGIADAIERENILYLKKFPKIGEKVAKQIILDLKGKLSKDIDLTASIDNTELVETLKALGYKSGDINKVLPHINKGNALELQVKEALKLLLRWFYAREIIW